MRGRVWLQEGKAKINEAVGYVRSLQNGQTITRRIVDRNSVRGLIGGVNPIMGADRNVLTLGEVRGLARDDVPDEPQQKNPG